MFKRSVIFLCVAFFAIFLFSESLWQDSYARVYSQKVNYKVDDNVLVEIDESTVVKYKSNTKTLKNYNLDVKSGKVKGLDEITPAGSAEESKSANIADEFSYYATLQAKVTEVNDNNVVLFGQKSIKLDNKTSVITVSGSTNLKNIINNSVKSSNLEGLKITVVTFNDNASSVLSDGDISEVESDLTDDKNNLELSEDKKLNLLQKYLNKLLNTVY